VDNDPVNHVPEGGPVSRCVRSAFEDFAEIAHREKVLVYKVRMNRNRSRRFEELDALGDPSLRCLKLAHAQDERFALALALFDGVDEPGDFDFDPALIALCVEQLLSLPAPPFFELGRAELRLACIFRWIGQFLSNGDRSGLLNKVDLIAPPMRAH
jgi:hypothetical protein